MKATRPCHQDTTITVSRAEGELVPVVRVPDAGVDFEAVERGLIQFALEVNAGNQTRAARFLGVSRSVLIYRMRKHGLVGKAGSE